MPTARVRSVSNSIEVDPQEDLCFYKTRTSTAIPPSVRTWASLQQHDFVTALAIGYLPFDSGLLIIEQNKDFSID